MLWLCVFHYQVDVPGWSRYFNLAVSLLNAFGKPLDNYFVNIVTELCLAKRVGINAGNHRSRSRGEDRSPVCVSLNRSLPHPT